MKRGFLVSVVFLAACAAAKPGDPNSPGTPIGAACVTLRSLHCPEGMPRVVNGSTRTCAESIGDATAALGVGFPSACITAATTPEAVRACGDPSKEMTVRCKVPQ